MSLFSKKETVVLDVRGMHCEKCVARVTEALESVDGVTGAEVSLEGNSATVEGHGFDAAALVVAVQDAGFEASPAV
ncbi:MAG TPA: heavy metal transport/detoxification protein [Eggerthellaceae bacterium]|nr:heavy metal transport/detoxification protein [Eggerthellaceae bacterium]